MTVQMKIPVSTQIDMPVAPVTTPIASTCASETCAYHGHIQTITAAMPAKIASPKLRILGARQDNAAFYHRVQAPFMVLERSSHNDWHVRMPSPEMITEYDVMWLHQHVDPVSYIVSCEFHDAGWPIVYDVDDWMFQYPPSWGGSDTVTANRLEMHRKFLALADVITTTTTVLAEQIRLVLKSSPDCENPDKPIVILPNCILAGEWDMLPKKGHNLDGPVLGWFGGYSHWDDWFEIAPVVDAALEDSHGYLMFIGPRELTYCFPPRLAARTRMQDHVSLSKFGSIAGQVTSFDVALAWATDRTMVSRCRSPLKMYQYLAAGVPVIASQRVYGETACELCNDAVLFADNPGDLYDAIVSCLACVRDGDRDGADANLLKAGAKLWQNHIWDEHSYEAKAGLWEKVLEVIP